MVVVVVVTDGGVVVNLAADPESRPESRHRHRNWHSKWNSGFKMPDKRLGLLKNRRSTGSPWV